LTALETLSFKASGAVHPAPASLTDEEFKLFRSFFYKITGIQFSEAQRYFVDKRLLSRIRLSGEASVRTYIQRLEHTPVCAEMNELVHVMTVKQTYFFREKYQFECLVNTLLPEYALTRTEKKPIRIWSIPSSSGDEPYSIAIYLKEFWRDLPRCGVEILGSDLDERILDVARQGQYATGALQAIPANLLKKYFTERPYGGHEVNGEIKRLVQFKQANIHRLDVSQHFSNFDVIFCRNLLIYFDHASKTKAISQLFEALKPGGFLCLGHSESLSKGECGFEARRFKEATVYQKPK
jgi:chemotaxis protein methyltransferase CheR